MILELVLEVVSEVTGKLLSKYIDYIIVPDETYWPEKEIQAKLDYLNNDNPFKNPNTIFRFKECNNLKEELIIQRLKSHY